jgi:hypothetical protein
MTLRNMPGMPYKDLMRVVVPNEQQMLESVADLLAKS